MTLNAFYFWENKFVIIFYSPRQILEIF